MADKSQPGMGAMTDWKDIVQLVTERYNLKQAAGS
jgi:hypothetical protein